MRSLRAGLILLLLLPASALAQATGQVLKVGFQNNYRPDCWVPMLVQLTGQSEETHKYQIQVVQEDLDSDRAVYVTPDIVVEGKKEGQPPPTVEYWVYFRPKPTGRGLPEASGVGSLSDLQAQLKVFLCDENGKQLSVLPLTSAVASVDPPRDAGDTSRPRRLVLFVSDGGDAPRLPGNGVVGGPSGSLKGVMEDVAAVDVNPRNNDLPGNVIGYEGVDAIVWMDADARTLTEGTNRSLDAIKEWVRQGGRLVVTQPEQPFKVDKLADLLPVKSDGGAIFSVKMEQRSDVDALRRILEEPTGRKTQGWPAKWTSPAGPFMVARARPTDDAVVEEWVDWTTPDAALGTRTPYIARRPYGLGSVTWVAQDLGGKALTNAPRPGWPVVWDRVFGLNNKTDGEGVTDTNLQDEIGKKWAEGNGADLGYALLNGMELSNKTAYLIGIASFFFIGYWFVAGPGVYLVLAGRKQTHLSWFAFGATAVVATALTVLLVRLVVRGAPELRHVSEFRAAPGGPAVAYSRFGLYIPRDGDQQVILEGTDPRPVSSSYLTAFAINPQYLKGEEDQFPAYLDYAVKVHDGTQPADVRFPYRSTLKKLEAKWVGPAGGGIDSEGGAVRCVDAGKNYLQGKLFNHTGRDLRNVYMAFRHPGSKEPADRVTNRDRDEVVYVDKWFKDAPLDLNRLMAKENRLQTETDNGQQRHVPSRDQVVYGWVGVGDAIPSWERYWYSNMRSNGEDTAGESVEQALPLLSFYGLLAPMSSQPNPPDESRRYELYRRGAQP